jgi:beta-glucosidase
LHDYFEWTLGYSKRFGLVHVDLATLERGPRNSFHFYAQLANGAGLKRE